SATGGELVGEPHLCRDITAVGGLLIPSKGLVKILADGQPLREKPPQGRILVARREVSGGGSGDASRRAAAVEIDFAESALRRHRALLRGGLEPLHGVDEILRHATTGFVK